MEKRARAGEGRIAEQAKQTEIDPKLVASATSDGRQGVTTDTNAKGGNVLRPLTESNPPKDEPTSTLIEVGYDLIRGDPADVERQMEGLFAVNINNHND